MSRVLSIASSFFAASFIVLIFLGLLAWFSTAALADESLTPACGGEDACQAASRGDGNCGLYDCDALCCCYCDVNCDCHDTGFAPDTDCEDYCYANQ
jgi:hypothetical protein